VELNRGHEDLGLDDILAEPPYQLCFQLRLREPAGFHTAEHRQIEETVRIDPERLFIDLVHLDLIVRSEGVVGANRFAGQLCGGLRLAGSGCGGT